MRKFHSLGKINIYFEKIMKDFFPQEISKNRCQSVQLTDDRPVGKRPKWPKVLVLFGQYNEMYTYPEIASGSAVALRLISIKACGARLPIWGLFVVRSGWRLTLFALLVSNSIVTFAGRLKSEPKKLLGIGRTVGKEEVLQRVHLRYPLWTLAGVENFQT
jgi:hypothetical protein